MITHNQSRRVARKDKNSHGYCTNESIFEAENYNNDRSMVFKKYSIVFISLGCQESMLKSRLVDIKHRLYKVISYLKLSKLNDL